MRMDNLYTAVLGFAGSGKMIPNDETVMTPSGPTKMGNISLGDYVISKDGNPTKVIKVIKQDNLNIYKLTFNDGTFVECCEDHLWEVQTNNNIKTNKYQVLSVKQMLFDITKDMPSRNGRTFSIDICNEVAFDSKEVVLDPYTLGYLLSKPSLLNSNGVRNNPDMSKQVDSLGLINRFIPDCYLINSIEIRKSLLAGLLDNAGSIQVINNRSKKCSFGCNSIKLIEDITFLIRSLGGIVHKPVRSKRNGEMSIRWRLPFNPFFKNVKKTEAYDSVNNNYRFIKKIVSAEFIGKKDGQCIDVDDPSHLFLVKDFIVTHNSYRLQKLLEEDNTYALKTSSSGISAVNIGGTTINSTLGYFNTEDLLYKTTNRSVITTLNKIRKKYKRLALDEVGMYSGQQLDLLMYSVQLLNKENPQSPLGIEISGDFGQLSPVVTGSTVLVPAFQAKCWPLFNVIHLTEAKRQDNPEFVKALLQVRSGNIKDALEWFESKVTFHSQLDKDFVGTTILSTNREVDAFNNQSLKKLDTTEKPYKKVLKGQAKTEWSNIPDELVLKPDCTVLMLINNIPEFANGDLAIVKEVFLDSVLVEIVRTRKHHMVTYHELTNVPVGTTKTIGSLKFLPLKLAYSSTVFKAQSLTLKSVQVKFTDNFWKVMHGGLYTALSRCSTPEGLRLVGSKDAFIKACYVNPIYLPYIKGEST